MEEKDSMHQLQTTHSMSGDKREKWEGLSCRCKKIADGQFFRIEKTGTSLYCEGKKGEGGNENRAIEIRQLKGMDHLGRATVGLFTCIGSLMDWGPFLHIPIHKLIFLQKFNFQLFLFYW